MNVIWKITQYPKNESKKTALEGENVCMVQKLNWLSINQSFSLMLENELMRKKLHDNEIQSARIPKWIRAARMATCAVFMYLQCAWIRNQAQVIPINVFLSSSIDLMRKQARGLILWNTEGA